VASTPLPRPSPVTEPNQKLVFVTPDHLREPRQRWDEFFIPKPTPQIEEVGFESWVKSLF